MIRLWNTLPAHVRQEKHYTDFLNHMHQKYKIHEYIHIDLFNYDTEIDNIYMKMRYHCSKLNVDQFKLHFVQDSKCTQCHKNKQETLHHYFMDCSKYDQQRRISKQNLSKLHVTFQNLTNRQLVQLISGFKDNNIDNSVYKNAYQYIKLYIVTTGRFI